MTTPPSNPAADAVRKISVLDLAALRDAGTRIVVVTAYEASSARLADEAGVDIILVGDSAGNTVLGYDSTVPVTMDEMLVLTRAVARVARRAMVVADMPFGSYQASDEEAVANATRFVKDAGADAVKLEGAGRTLPRVSAILGAGIPVMGHVGLTPQSASLLRSFKARGRTAAEARRILEDASALERTGCFSIVLEAIPAALAARISTALTIPTIGIGAGPACGGQVLVWHDLLGLTPGQTPRFVKRYAALGETVLAALRQYARDVRAGSFPEQEHSYAMPADELAELDTDAPAGERKSNPLLRR
jgi:3-methyl-2-oxobutanoate hydroxymethyltransferase